MRALLPACVLCLGYTSQAGLSVVDSSRWLVVSGTSKTGRHSKKPKAVLCSAGSRQLLQVSDPTATAAAAAVVVVLCSALHSEHSLHSAPHYQ